MQIASVLQQRDVSEEYVDLLVKKKAQQGIPATSLDAHMHLGRMHQEVVKERLGQEDRRRCAEADR